MKQLTCEMCGSTDLIKQDGVFVCQSCGCRYSVEEAKKMMIEGTVSIDNTHMIEQWMKLAQAAESANNHKEAYDYYTKVVEIDPNNWKAIYGKGKNAAWQSSLSNIRISELYQAINKSLEIIDRELPFEEQSEIRIDFCWELVNVNNAITRLYDNEVPNDRLALYMHLHEASIRRLLIRHMINASKLSEALTLIKGYENQFTQDILKIKRMVCKDIRTATITYWCKHDYQWSYLEDVYLESNELDSCFEDWFSVFIEYMYDIKQIDPKFGTNVNDLPDIGNKEPDDLITFWQEMYENRCKFYKNIAKTHYWEEHKEEKKQIEEKIAELRQKLIPLQSKQQTLINQKHNISERKNSLLPSENALGSIISKIKELNTELNNIGLFSFKRKKEIQSELDSLNIERVRFEEQLSNERMQLNREINEQIENVDGELNKINSEITPLTQELSRLEYELDRDR